MNKTLLAILAVLAFVGLSYQSQLRLTVYYESRCPDSRRFIVNQLYPTLQLLNVSNNYFEAEFIPYGKATTEFVNGTFYFDCQHGNNECLGNKIHACALAKMSKIDSFALINCMMDNFDAPNDGPICATRLGLNYTAVDACYNGWEGDTLLAAHGIKTHDLNPTLYYVPWIMYEDVWTAEDMIGSEVNLMQVLCRKLPAGNRPPQCG